MHPGVNNECNFILANKSILYCIIDKRNAMYFIYLDRV